MAPSDVGWPTKKERDRRCQACVKCSMSLSVPPALSGRQGFTAVYLIPDPSQSPEQLPCCRHVGSCQAIAGFLSILQAPLGKPTQGATLVLAQSILAGPSRPPPPLNLSADQTHQQNWRQSRYWHLLSQAGFMQFVKQADITYC